MDLYARLRQLDDAIQAGGLSLLDVFDAWRAHGLDRLSRAQVHTATVRDRQFMEPREAPKPRRVVPVKHRRKRRT